MKKNILWLFAMLVTCKSIAQQPAKWTNSNPQDRYADWVEFSSSNAPFFREKQVYLLDHSNKVSFSSNTILVNKEVDQLGFTLFRYQQTINNIPVENAVYLQHVKNSRLLIQNGKWLMRIPAGLASAPVLQESAALQYALQFIGAASYKWQDPTEEAFIKNESGDPRATFYPKGKLIYYSGEDDLISSSLRLAFQFDIYASNPVGRKIVFVDAATGAILGSRELLHNTYAVGTAVTAYSGSQPITTDSYQNYYRLREVGRGNGIQTYNLRKSISYGSAVDFQDADNNWNNVNTSKDQYATDAHWGAEMTYDFFKNNFNRNSIDNNGFLLKSYVHYSMNYFNAFWDGSRMTYGDGSSTDGYKPLTALDVCGHEISHGLTSNTARLNYSYESGALNEGFSDIFGTAIEWYARPAKRDWLIGGDFYIIRSMSNPNAYSQPDTYLGSYWYTGTSDNGGVHRNSGVINFWFYLLCNGGTGINDKGFAYNVSVIGMDKAQAIAFRTLTVYLVSTSKYANARTASIQAATDLYGAASDEVTQTMNAWDAVGVGGGTAPAVISSRALASITGSSPEKDPSLLIYPNPVENTLFMEFNDFNTGQISLQLVDGFGRIVRAKDVYIRADKSSQDMDVSALPSGTYFLRYGAGRARAIYKK
jgi:hypothetical protein